MTNSKNVEFFGLETGYRNHNLILNKDGGVYGTGGHTGMVQRIEAGRDPLPIDDGSDSTAIGIRILLGSLWINKNTKKIFFCSDNTTGSAVWVEMGSGSGGSVILYDESTILGQITTLRAVGVGVSAAVVGTDGYLYIPPASFAPWYNTGGCAVSGISTINRHVANPTLPNSPYDIGDWIGNSVHPCHQLSTDINYNTPVPCSFENDTNTTFEVTILGSDDITPISNFETPIITGNGVFTGSNITVTVSNWIVENTKFKADIDVKINILSILPNGGRYSVLLVHHNDGIDYSFYQSAMFMDQEDNVAILSGVSIQETSGSVVTTKISGVEYYTLGSNFTIDIANIDHINDSSYPTNQISVIGSNYGLPSLLLEGSDLNGWTSAWDNVNASYNKTDWTVNAVQFCSVNENAIIRSRTEDWISNAYVDSVDSPICVNTYTDNSTRIYEDFKLEVNRLESDFITPWDNTRDLTSYDGNDGLQYQCSRLIYPQLDFKLSNPNPLSQPDYSGLVGDRAYRRRWWHDGISHSNGLLQFGDYNVSETNLTSHELLIEVSLDNINWFILNDNYLGGSLSDGDGCRINPSVHALNTDGSIEFTLGTGGFTSISSGGGWGLFMRITYSNTIFYIGSLNMINWI